MAYEFPPAWPHGELREIFDDIFFVQGTVAMNRLIRFSRNMTVLRHGDSLTVVNSMRLDESGLEALDALGNVKHVVRICGFHGMDDPFYKDRYGATVWAVEGMRYVKGFKNTRADPPTYFAPDQWLTADSELPVPGARLHVFSSCHPPEAILLLDRDGGVALTGDSLQNWDEPDEYFSLAGTAVMKVMGFFKPCNVGPGWLKSAKPSDDEVRGILDLDFDHVLPVHGAPVLGDARDKFEPAIRKASRA